MSRSTSAAEALKQNRDISQPTNRGYVPGMNADSVQAVIDHTQAIRAQNNNSEAVNDIIRRRDEIQGNIQLNDSALKSVENKPEVMRSQSTNIEKMFGTSGITAADFERKIDSRREEVLSTENGITIFASFSLPDYVLEDLLRTASQNKARVVFNGLKKGTTRLPETQAAINQLVVKGKFDSPLITIDPDAFDQYQSRRSRQLSPVRNPDSLKWSVRLTLISSSENWPEIPIRIFYLMLVRPIRSKRKALLKSSKSEHKSMTGRAPRSELLQTHGRTNSWLICLRLRSTRNG